MSLDKIVCGVASSFVRKQLLKEREPTLDRASEIGLLYELSDRENSELSNEATASKEDVQSVSKGKTGY